MRAVAYSGIKAETFRPWVISRRPGLFGSVMYFCRLMIDCPVRSLITGLKPLMCNLGGRVLDVGAGSQFYRSLLPQEAQYTALEVLPQGPLYGWENEGRNNLDYYDGKVMPYPDSSFDHVICLEVLEHTEEPTVLLGEIARVLKPSGTAILSAPFAAKWHYIPHDFWRFTPAGLERLVSKTEGLQLANLYRRGGDFSVAFHMATVSLIGLLFRRSLLQKALGVLSAPVAVICGILANLCEILDLGAPENTLGYVCTLRKL